MVQGLEVDFTQYSPLISWVPCSIHREDPVSLNLETAVRVRVSRA